ncbi:Na,H/K antiporter P-type ATPase, alpha subunit family protein (macronuclear) [Tetrahymena thermophila SB210]|uniref:Na,H/K antiporter P-type ATPase, alpha subunit family protein n=1 Tax=Tetrahymena thermophila (strain SB210) TaxID=312017 RepID=Q22PA2_TETTS|nr:Na,H/K antiporter P-type ATPase, alpha subunit family protein [Tetrahymena thermophila SB210]EAR87207.2 Na,H/K antiporter P-type ATPase, alpha subunit family protein [Tetrahymena thermophila SB210]|eukprot:XP_001007452.2 Na,H/K antiporter P-type ATPase, alpha subunit family protein [Tetrahymena thermophila SB210]
MQKKQSQVIPTAFEELRQSICLTNSIIQYRKKLASILDSIKLESIGGHNNHLQHQPCCEQEINFNYDDDDEDLEAHQIQATKKQQPLVNKKDLIQNQMMQRDEHKVELKILVKRYGTDIQNGHKQQKAEQLNIQLGDNKLSEKPKEPLIFKFLRELITPFAILLWISSIVCFVAYKIKPQNSQNLYFGIILIFVVLITAFITFQQNKKSEAILDSFKSFLPQKCVVIRDGSETQINSQKLVLGDIVKIKAGEKIPADIRLIRVNEMKVDNSALTGESESQIRSTFCSHPESLLETSNVAFFGTLCKEGQGIGIVIQIGDKTTLGEIASMASAEKKTKTPLRIELDRLILFMVFVALSLGILFFLLSYFHAGYDAITSIVYGIGILVVNVPEGLICCITISLAITAKSLHRKNVLVKNLESVETLGSTSCICSDKTGTLTQNVMTVEHIWISGQEIKATNKKYVEDATLLNYYEKDIAFKELHLNAILSSEAKFDISQIEDKKNIDYFKCLVNGDATETGLIRFFQSIEDIQKTRDKYRIAENKEKNLTRMPFNSTEKFALTIVENVSPTSDYCIYVKGAPEKIWNFCSYIQNGNKEEIINDQWDINFERINKKFGKSSERVIGFAKLLLHREQYPLKNYNFQVQSPKTFNFPLRGYVFTGLISLIDPPKIRVPNAILECRSAGIKVIMVTGDQPSTAASIAKQVNIIPNFIETTEEMMNRLSITWEEAVEQCTAIVIHGDKIVQSISFEEQQGIEKFTSLREWIKKPYCVFARTTPAQKLQIVQACQKEGQIVAVTGDGVNDSPAIKQGNIGISMNLTGSDVTKDAADMILLDDDFASIVAGIEEGRKIFDNLKKTFVYLLCSNIPEILPFLAFIIFSIPLPLSNIYMLCICVGTDIYPAISLGYEEAEVDIMTRRPRQKNDHLVSLKLMTHSYGLMGIMSMSCGFIAYFISLNYFGFKTLELFGMATYSAYKPPAHLFTIDPKIAQFSQYQQYGVMYNSNVMLGSKTCDEDLYILKQNYKDFLWIIDWTQIQNGQYDLRKAFIECKNGKWQSKVGGWSDCNINSSYTYSDFVQNTACYSTDALKYAQSSFFCCIVIFQWSNIFACKARKSSFCTSPFNIKMIQGIFFETCLAAFLVLTPGVNTIFGGRPIEFWQFGVSGVPFSIMVLAWNEVRKYLIRKYRWFLKYSYW